MGYWGGGAFENDDAADWLADVTTTAAVRRIANALRKAKEFSSSRVVPWPAEKIDRFIDSMINIYKTSPPEAWLHSGRLLDDHLVDEKLRLRNYYYSGQYMDEQYGPMEQAIAAAELVAMWGNCLPPRAAPYDEPAKKLINSLRKSAVSASLVTLARDAMKAVLTNTRYRRMRKFYLNAFPDMSGGDDSMVAVKDLSKRLEQIEVSPAVSKAKVVKKTAVKTKPKKRKSVSD